MYFSFRNSVLSYYEKFPSEEYFNEKKARSYLHNDQTKSKGVLRVAHVEALPGNSLGFKVYGTSGKSIDIRAAKANIRTVWLRALTPAVRDRSRAWSGDESPLNSNSLGSFDLERSSSSSPVLKSGWMFKRSEILKQWRRYYFVLQGNMLSYYMSDKPYEVPRRRGYVTSVARSTSSRGGLIVALNSGAALHVAAEDRVENDMWFGMLEACLNQKRRETILNQQLAYWAAQAEYDEDETDENDDEIDTDSDISCEDYEYMKNN